MKALDTIGIDRELRRAASEWRRWRRLLRRADGAEEDPFAVAREVTTRSNFRAIAELPETDPLRQPLLRWIYRLAEQRINGAAIAYRAATWREVSHRLNLPEPGRFSLQRMLANALREPARAPLWVDALTMCSERNAAASALLWERRQQVATGFGLDGPDTLELPGSDVYSAAEAFLGATYDAFDALSVRDLPGFIDLALGREAVDGWPARLTPVAVSELLRATNLLRDLGVDPGPLPELIGGSSFVRALSQVGAAIVDATAPPQQPFVVANDPYGLERMRMGALLGALPGTTPFARRVLGLSGARLERHLRALARITLLEGRGLALRVLLRRAALSGRRALGQAFEEHSARALGFPADPRLAGVLFRLHVDDGQRFAGLLLAAVRSSELESRHDEDWYRNPRAQEEIRGGLELSPATEANAEELAEGGRLLSANLGAMLA